MNLSRTLVVVALAVASVFAQGGDEAEQRRVAGELDALRATHATDLAARRARIDALRRSIAEIAPTVDAIEKSVVEASATAEVGALSLPADTSATVAEESAVRDAVAAAGRLAAIGDLDAAVREARGVRIEGRTLHVGTLFSVERLDGDRAYLVYPQRPTPIGPVEIPGLSAVFEGGPTGAAWIPMEVTGRLKADDVRARRDIASWIAAGGPIVVIILVVGGLALLVALMRLAAVHRTRPIASSNVEAARAALDRGDLAEALGRLRSAGVEGIHLADAVAGIAAASGEDRRTRVDVALDAAALRHERATTFVAAAAGITPLLGLLGTVMGMITTFEGVGGGGTDRSAMLSRGISEALITTEAGLLFAIPLLLLHALILSRAEALAAAFEDQLGALLPKDAA